MTYGVSLEDTIWSLEQFASFLKANRENLEGVEFDCDFGIVNVTPEVMKQLLSCSRPFDNRWRKDATTDYFHLTTKFGLIEFDALAARETVCQAVPTGRTVTTTRMVEAAKYEDIEVPEVEWICAPVLAVATAPVDETADF